MKKLASLFLLLSLLLTACGANETDQSDGSTWQGAAPGADLSAVTERTEYYGLTVETETIFDMGLWEKNPQDKTVGQNTVMGGTAYLPLGTQFLQGEPVQYWVKLVMGIGGIRTRKGISTAIIRRHPV